MEWETAKEKYEFIKIMIVLFWNPSRQKLMSSLKHRIWLVRQYHRIY